MSGCLYEISRQFGAFVAVDNQYSALIPPKEMYGELKVGDHVEARVVRVHEDGKLDLSVREKAYLQIETDVEKVMKLIDSFDGVLPFTDKASPGGHSQGACDEQKRVQACGRQPAEKRQD